jgi:hypothetical protein
MTSTLEPLELVYLLIDRQGQPYKDSSIDLITLPSKTKVARFRDAVKVKYNQPGYLLDIPASALKVFKDKAAFDSDSGKEPLGPISLLDSSLGTNEENALIVVVPAEAQLAIVPAQAPPTFTSLLRSGGINRPDAIALGRLVSRFPEQLREMRELRRVEPCVDLYRTVKNMASTATCGVIQADMNVSINGPLSLANPDILIAFDLANGNQLLIKLLRIPLTTASQSSIARNESVTAEVRACSVLSQAKIPGLVKCEAVEVDIHDSRDLNVASGKWAALKMKRYITSLCGMPQLTEPWLYKGFSRISKALKSMHELGLVHSDVKADNVFVDEVGVWYLGDFGSARKIRDAVWSYTDVFTPFIIPSSATVIPAMDFVLLCVTIAVELDKKNWERLRGSEERVQEPLILQKLNPIQDDNFKKEVIELLFEGCSGPLVSRLNTMIPFFNVLII